MALADCLGEALLPGIIGEIGTRRLGDRAALRRRSAGNNVRPKGLRNLDRGKAHAARATVDENILALGDACTMHKREPRGREGYRHGRGGFHREARRNREEMPGRRHEMRGEGIRREAHHAVTHGEFAHAFADAGDNARAFETERGSREARAKQVVIKDAEAHEDIAEIQADRRNLDFHLHPRAGRGAGPSSTGSFQGVRLLELQNRALIGRERLDAGEPAPHAERCEAGLRGGDLQLATPQSQGLREARRPFRRVRSVAKSSRRKSTAGYSLMATRRKPQRPLCTGFGAPSASIAPRVTTVMRGVEPSCSKVSATAFSASMWRARASTLSALESSAK